MGDRLTGENQRLDHLVICPQCHTLYEKVPLPPGQRAKCRVCGTVLYRHDPRYLDRALALSITGILLFLIANLFPLVKIDMLGHKQYVSIFEALYQLYASGFYIVTMAVAFMVLIIPILVMVDYTVVAFLMRQRRAGKVVRDLLVLLAHLLPWSMVDIFAVSILVALVKLRDEVSIYFGLSFWALIAYVMIDIYLTKAKRLGHLWELYYYFYQKERVPAGRDPSSQEEDGSHTATTDTPDALDTGETPDVIRCPVCEAVNYAQNDPIVCHRCGSNIYRNSREGVSRTWALLLTAMLLYFPANLYPILEIKSLFGHSSNTIIGGVIALWDDGSYPVALIIFLASVLVPILKFILLLYLLISIRYPVAESKSARHRLFTFIEIIGPWSMVDVFVVTILTGLVKYDSFKIIAGPGATAFVLMVFFTMLAALSFDPRWIKDSEEIRREHVTD